MIKYCELCGKPLEEHEDTYCERCDEFLAEEEGLIEDDDFLDYDEDDYGYYDDDIDDCYWED